MRVGRNLIRTWLLVFLAAAIPTIASAQILPLGFVDEPVVSGLYLPTSFTELPDGRMLVGEKNGVIRIVKNGTLLPTPFIDISASVNDYWDRGLLSVAADQNFTTNGYVYLYYVYENNPSDYSGTKTSRLTRVTATGDVANPASQVVILGKLGNGSSCAGVPAGGDCIEDVNPSHTAGDIHIAPDGTLFLTHGDAASFNVVDDAALNAQDIDSLRGKVLHITTTGAGIATNPFWNGDPNANRSKVYAYGFRNPYRFSLHSSGAVFVGDVGWNTWEEINVISPTGAGANLGWPCYEGPLQQDGYAPETKCQALYALGAGAVQQPTVPYPHLYGTSAVTAGGFYTGTSFPPQYRGAFFYADYAIGVMRYFRVDANGAMSGPVTGFAATLNSPVYIGTDGENLLYVAINSGEVRRIRYTGASQNVSYLSDRSWTSMTNGYGPVERDESNGYDGVGDGRVISLKNQVYAKGLGTNAPSDVRFALNASCSTFAGAVGLDDVVTTNGSVVFQVWTDGTKIFDSGLMTGNSATKPFSLTVTGVNELRLVVTDGGDGGTLDNADWADARVTCNSPADVTPPAVTVVDPEAFSTGVVVSGNILATFSEPINPSTLTSATVKLVQQGGASIPGTVSYDAASQTVTFNPTSDLATSTPFTATIVGGAAGVKDLSGNALASNKVWSFTTTASETTPPTVMSVGPADGSTGQTVAVNTTAIFSEAMDPSSLTTTSVTIVPQGSSTPVPAAITYAGTTFTVTLDPTANLKTNTTYTARIKGGSGGAKDGAGNPLVADKVWTFTTAPPAATSFLSDLQWTSMTNGWGPIERDHSNGDLGASDGGPIVLDGVTYTKGLGGNAPSDVRYALNGGCSLFTTVVGVDDETGASGSVVFQVWVDGVKRYDSGTMTGLTTAKNVSVDVSGGTELQLVITDAADGNSFDHGDWASAKVACGTDTVPPTVVSAAPASGAGTVAIGTAISATFSEGMDPASLSTATVTLVPQGRTTSVAATVAYDATTLTVSLNPTSNLAPSTLYTATIKGGLSGAKDLAGNPLAADVAWNFTTAVAGASQYVSDLTWTSMSNGWGPVEKDRTNGDIAAGDGGPLIINGVTYAKGLGAHAPSDVRYGLNAQCNTLTAVVGLDDDTGTAGSVVFQIWVDGIQRYDSGIMTGVTAAKNVNVDVTGAFELAFIVTDAGNGNAFDHADWANAQLSCIPDTTVPTVTSSSPPANAIGVAGTVSVTATFSEAMQASTFTTGSVTLVPQGSSTPVAATVTYDATAHTVTLAPAATLTAGTHYVATIKGGSSGVKDLAGNPLAADQVWTFAVNAPPVPTISQPLSTFKFKVGDVIPFTGSATDPEDGVLPAGSLHWDVTLFHCQGGTCHTHPFINTNGTSGSFTAPDHGDDVYFEVKLTATDSAGQTGITITQLQPVTVQLTLDTSPTGLQVVYGGTGATSPTTYTTLVGSAHTIFAPSPQGGAAFGSWSDNGAQQHNITVGAVNLGLVATFGPPDTTPPTVTMVSPPASATGIAGSANVTATFSEAMNAATLTTATFSVVPQGSSTPVTATVTYDAATRTVTLDPTGTLAASATYTATIRGGSAGAQDAANNPLAADRVWTFTTAAVADTTPPTVTVVTPVNGATGVSGTTNVTATFSEAMDPTTLVAATVTLMPQGTATPIAATITYDAVTKVVTLRPTAALNASAVYVATIKSGSGGAKDLAGNALVADKVWTFTTTANDTTPPIVTDVTPLDGATAQLVAVNMTAIFSEAIQSATLTSTTVTLTPQGSATLVPAAISYNSATFTVTLDPTANLTQGTTYTVTIKGGSAGVKDLAGNPMVSDRVWTFTTAGAVDTTPPTVTTVSPANLATGIAVTVNTTAAFSEAMQSATLTTATVTLVPQGSSTPVPAAVSYNATTTTVTLDPTASLAAGTTYTATIRGGSSGAKDVAGNPLAADRVWSFTTAGVAGGSSYLSDRTWTSMTNGWGPVELDHTNGDNAAGDGGPIVIAGITYPKGLGAHAPSDVRYALNGACSLFTAIVGIDDDAGSNGSVVFQVWVDGVSRYDSGVTTGVAAGKSVSVDVTGGNELRLVVTDGGDGISFDHADWGNAQVTCGADLTPPTVTSVSPLANASGVAVASNVTATFSEAMLAASLTATTVTVVPQGSSTPVAAAVSYDATSRTVTLDPTASLAVSTLYTATVKSGSSGAKDLAGNPLTADFVWTFTTGAAGTSSYLSDRTWTSMTNGWGPVELDRTNGDLAAGDGGPLVINGVTYAKGLGAHAPSDVRYALAAQCNTFTAVVGVDDDAGSNGSIVFQVWVDGVQRYDSGTMTGITAAAAVNVSVTGASELRLVVTDSGNGNAYDHADWANAQVSCGSDVTPPTVTTISPAANATGVAVAATATAVFSEGMLATSLSTTTMTLVPQGSSTPVAATVVYDAASRTVTLDPTANLAVSTLYTATIKGGSAGAKDLAGNPMTADRVWTFTTAAAGAASYLSDRTWTSMTNGWGPVELDRTNGDLAAGDGGPLVVNGATYAKGLGAHAPSDIRYAISGCSTFAAVIGVDDDAGSNGSVVFQVWLDGVQKYDSGVLTGASATKSAVVDVTGASELRLVVTDSGNGNAFDHADWADAQVSCSGGSDVTPPTVSTLGPAANASGVALTTNVTAVFSEAVQAATVTTATVTVVPQGSSTPVTATVSYDAASRTVTLDPTPTLAVSTVYTATIKGGSSGVKDLAGNALAADRVWSFTTGVTGNPVFQSPVAYPAGVNTHSVTVADLNRDGKLDLIAANAGSAQVTVYLGNGNGTFAPGVFYSVGNAPKHVALADFNGDTFLDLATSNQDDSTVTIRLGRGDGTFGALSTVPVCSRAHESAAADFNGDGKQDLVVACWGGSVVSVLLGHGDGTFDTAVSYQVQANPHSVAIGDFDKDGKLDVAVANNVGNSVSVLLGLGNGTFKPAVSYPVGAGPHAVRTADLNGDGKLDLVNSNNGASFVSVLLGNGDGTFASAINYPSGIDPAGIALADVTGDGILDILTANTGGNYPVCCNPGGDTFSILAGNGNGTFKAPVFYTTGTTPFSIAVADLNGDGKPDVATANWDSNNVNIHLNTGGFAGIFAPPGDTVLASIWAAPPSLNRAEPAAMVLAGDPQAAVGHVTATMTRTLSHGFAPLLFLAVGLVGVRSSSSTKRRGRSALPADSSI